MALVQVADVVVPERFAGYVQEFTEEKSRLIQSGVIRRSATLDGFLRQGGSVFSMPRFHDLANTADNVSSDEAAGANDSTPQNMGSHLEEARRMSRNQSWAAADLADALSGEDIVGTMQALVGGYWTRRLQAMFLAAAQGLFADNAAAPTGSDTHTQDDLTNDVSGVYAAGTTDFSASRFIDTLATMGDSDDSLGIVFVHSIVFNKMRKDNLISFVEPSDAKIRIPTFLNRRVIVDDGMPNSAGNYETWLFGEGAFRLGMGAPKNPFAVARNEDAGLGGGEERIYSRTEWLLHPPGHTYVGAPTTVGGPSNASTANNLANAGSWSRRSVERKQIKIARLITTEHAP